MRKNFFPVFVFFVLFVSFFVFDRKIKFIDETLIPFYLFTKLSHGFNRRLAPNTKKKEESLKSYSSYTLLFLVLDLCLHYRDS
jgi:hypothetical protein